MPTTNAILRVAPALLLVCLAARTAAGQGSTDPAVASRGTDTSQLVGGRLPAAFLENLGQIDPRARFYTSRRDLRAYFTTGSIALQLDSCEHAKVSVFLHFEGASRDLTVEGTDPLEGRYHYLLGEDPAQWRRDVRSYAGVRYRHLYPGIDLLVHERNGDLEYDLIFEPGADPRDVVVRCEGAQSLEISDGTLVVNTAAGPLVQPAPETYRIGADGLRHPVLCWYRLLGEHCFGFDVPNSSVDQVLVIDPGLLFATFLGGSGTDYGDGVALAPDGGIVVVGETQSADFPVTPGGYDTSHNGLTDVFVAKLTADGSTLLQATFVGGSSEDYTEAIRVDALGEAVVVGHTSSTNYPVTPGAFDTTSNGGGDVFVTKLSADGASLVYSTYIGGSNLDTSRGLALDAAGAAFVTGYTISSNFPVTPGAYDTTNGLGGFEGDVFVTKVSPDGSKLVYSTFLGDKDPEAGLAIAVDGDGAAYVTGFTFSSSFPTTPNAYDTTFNNGDTFVTKLSPDGSGLVYSTFLGGSKGEAGTAIVVDAAGVAVIAGSTISADFPTTPGAYDTALWVNFNEPDAFVTKLSADGATLVYSTYLGAESQDDPTGIALDANGAAVVCGNTYSKQFPMTPGAYDTTFDSGHSHESYVTRVSADGTTLLYSTFLSHADWTTSVVLDATGSAIVSGFTREASFPATPGAYDTSFNGGIDGFVLEFTAACDIGSGSAYGSGWPGTLGIPSLTISGNPSFCAVTTLVLENSRGAPTTGTLLIGSSVTDLPTIFDGHVLLVPLMIIPLSIPGPSLSLPAHVPCDGLLCGFPFFAQAVEIDPGASQGVSFTPGLQIILGS